MSDRDDGTDGAFFVQFRSVDKSYDGETLVVRNLSLGVHEGEFLTLLGPSGSGKTTTLLMLAGFEEPDSGEILLANRRITHTPPQQRNIGMVFQNYALFPNMTVAGNVAYPLLVRRRPKSEIAERVERALDMVHLSRFRDRRPRALSGGQQQRVALARALVYEPALLLLDEPLGALDKQLRQHMQLEIKHIQNRLGITALYVTHDQEEALTMSDRIAVFNDGTIQQLSSPETLYESPENSFVANFIGENNALKGTVREIEGETCRIVLDAGDILLAQSVNIGCAGSRTTVSIRPERIRVGAAAGGEQPNTLRATVRELIYTGSHVRVRFALGGENHEVTALLPAEDARNLIIGETVAISLPPAHCRAMDLLD